ncbi:hypothetical protein [Erwinia billingiae]|uniref:hypothetical protein n=1 Tax=Erwinia billingiae TaxID=182337 RepID=UPI0005A2C547|nr:hypothetical protein [Erwinia billingiae]
MAAATERYYLCAPRFFATVARQILTDLDEDGQALLHQVTDFYHRNLPDNEGAQGWLAARALSCGAGGRLVRELRSTEPWPGVAALRASRAMADHMIMKKSARHLYLPSHQAGIFLSVDHPSASRMINSSVVACGQRGSGASDTAVPR